MSVKVKIKSQRPHEKVYYRIFQQDKDGQAVLDELDFIFANRSSYTKGDSHDTAYKEGQRSVISFILMKCGKSVIQPNENEGD